MNTMSSKVYPDYANDFKKEFLFLRGINTEFAYFHKCVFFYEAMTRSFSRKIKSIARLNKIINQYKKGLDSGDIRDLSNQEMGREVFDNIEILEDGINNLLDRYVVLDEYDEVNGCYFDVDKYEENVDIDFQGLRKMRETLEYYHEVIKYKEKIYYYTGKSLLAFDSDGEND